MTKRTVSFPQHVRLHKQGQGGPLQIPFSRQPQVAGQVSEDLGLSLCCHPFLRFLKPSVWILGQDTAGGRSTLEAEGPLVSGGVGIEGKGQEDSSGGAESRNRVAHFCSVRFQLLPSRNAPSPKPNWIQPAWLPPTPRSCSPPDSRGLLCPGTRCVCADVHSALLHPPTQSWGLPWCCSHPRCSSHSRCS